MDEKVYEQAQALTERLTRAGVEQALQCHLVMSQRGTAFLDKLSEELGADALAMAIHRYYQQQDAAIPAIYRPWTQPGEK